MVATQAALFETQRLNKPSTVRLGVFGDNRSKAIHRWYPFIEGYSADLVEAALIDVGGEDFHLFDPFGGSGTTALTAAALGFDCSFCEVNPYLAWVADVKVNVARAAADSAELELLGELAAVLEAGGTFQAPPGTHPLLDVDAHRHFFPRGAASRVVGLLSWIDANVTAPLDDLARLAVTTSLIPASNMVRRTDLRKRHAGDAPPAPLEQTVAAQLRAIQADVIEAAPKLEGRAVLVAADARTLTPQPRPFTTIVTSPPYLNGTNYCRNTKLELFALGLLEEAELAELRLSSITAGINNVSKRRATPTLTDEVEQVAQQLDAVAYDRRIPALVRLYFSDMQVVFERVRTASVLGALWLLDIGDSRFAGVNVPTPALLASIASSVGWDLEATETIRQRTSYDGTPLTQVLLSLKAV
jgi:hypothetical protein